MVDGATNTVLSNEIAYLGGMPYALGIDPGLGQLYVSFAGDPSDPLAPRQVLVFRVPSICPSPIGSVPVGAGGPDGGGGVVANPTTHHVFVTNSLDDSVTKFDGVSFMVLDTIPVGDDPHCGAVDPGLGYIYVGNRKSNTVNRHPRLVSAAVFPSVPPRGYNRRIVRTEARMGFTIVTITTPGLRLMGQAFDSLQIVAATEIAAQYYPHLDPAPTGADPGAGRPRAGRARPGDPAAGLPA